MGLKEEYEAKFNRQFNQCNKRVEKLMTGTAYAKQRNSTKSVERIQALLGKQCCIIQRIKTLRTLTK